MTTTITKTTQSRSARSPWARSRPLAVAAAVGVTALVWVLVGPIAGVDLAVRSGSAGTAERQVGPIEVLVTSLGISLAAWGLLAVLERRTRHGRAAWTIVALVVLALSMAGPLTGGISTADKAGLAMLHVALAAVLVPLLPRTGPNGPK